jgi:glycosyltransferase involved in cell wall biosynthesis
MRIVFVVTGSPESASPRYRAQHIADALTFASESFRQRFTEVQVVSSSTPYTVTLGAGDILVLHRLGYAGAGERFLHAAREVGAVTVWSTDDLIFTPDFAHQIGLHFPDDPIRYRQHQAGGQDFQRMLYACDAALVSTDYLAQLTRSTLFEAKKSESDVPPVYVIRNFLTDQHLSQAEAALRSVSAMPESLWGTESEPITLAYLSGSATHNIDLGTIAAPLATVLTRFPQVRLLLVGPVTLPPALRRFADAGQILRHSFVPWQDLPGLLTHGRVAVNLAPLDLARPFMHAKSEVKYLEAAAVGIPTIASPAAGFAEGVRDGEDCLLAANPADWERLLTELIQKPEVRRRLGNAAAAALRQRGTAKTNASIVQTVFEQISGMAPDGNRISTRESVVRPTLRERIVWTGRNVEQGLMRRYLRLSRHLHRLREDMSGG